MDIGTLTGYIVLEDNLTPALKTASKNLKSFSQSAKEAGTTLSAAITLPLAAAAAFATKAAIDFESSFAGVRKTVDATEVQFASLAQSFRDLAMEIPVSVNELNRIAEAGGQLGVATEDLEGFTRTMADMGIATNLSSDQAATSLAQIANIIKNEAGPQYDRLASTIVDLGNKSAATESDITEFGLRLAGAGKQAGLSEAEILGIGSALASVGINAEAGGTAFSKVMIDISTAAEQGGAKLEEFASVAGMSASDFKQKFETDAAGALVEFVKGLGNVEERGGSLFATLESLGITEQRMRDALLRTAGAGDLLAKSIDDGRAAWQANTALTAEAEKRYATTASQLTLLWNKIQDVAITLGDALLPIVIDLVKALEPMINYLADAAKSFAELPGPIKYTAIALAAVVAAAGPMVFLLGTLASSWASLIPLFAKGTTGAGLLSGAMKGLNVATGPIGLAIGALAIATWEVWQAWKHLNEEWAKGKSTKEVLTTRDTDNWARNSLISLGAWLHGIKTTEQVGKESIASVNASLQSLADKQKEFAGQPMDFSIKTTGDIANLERDLTTAAKAGALTNETIQKVQAALTNSGLVITAETPTLLALANAQGVVRRQTQDATEAAQANAGAMGAGVTEADRARYQAEQLQRRLEALRKDGLTPLTEAQKTYAAEAKRLGDDEAQIAKDLGVSERALHLYLETTEDARKKTEDHAKAVRDLVSDLTSVSSATLVTTDAFDKLTPAQLENWDVNRKLIPVLTTLAAEQGTLTAKQREALLGALEYREAFAVVEAQLLETKGITTDYVEQQMALGRSTAEIGAEFDVSAAAIEAFMKTQGELKDSTKRVADQWLEYYKTIAKGDKDLLATQLADVDAWYNAEYEAIEKSAVNNAASWEQLAGLNAIFWAKITKVRVDAETAANNRIKEARQELDDFVRQQTMTSTDFQVMKIWETVNEQIAADEKNKTSNAEVNALRIRLAQERTDALYVDNAALVSNSNESLQEIANRAATTYDKMASEPWKYSKAAIAAQMQVYVKAQEVADGITDTYGQALSGLAGMFQKLGQVAGDSLGAIMGNIGQIVVGLEDAHAQSQLWGKNGEKLGGSFGHLSTLMNDNATGAQKMASGIAIAANTMQGIADMKSAFDEKSTSKRLMGSTMAGAKIGSAFGPWGTAVGAAAGFVAGLIKGKPTWAKAQEEMAKSYGVNVSDELAKAISDTAKKEFKGNQDAARLTMMKDIIGDIGGLTDENVGKMTEKFAGVFDMVNKGTLTMAQGIKVVDENFAAFAEAGTSDVGLLSAAMVDVVKQTKALGMESEAVTQYLGQQGATGASAFGTYLQIGAQAILTERELSAQTGGTNEEIEERNQKLEQAKQLIEATAITSQASADALAAATMADFDAMIQAGMSYGEAVAAIQPAIEGLEIQMEAAGLTGGEVFNTLQGQVALYSDEVSGPALQAVEALSSGMVTLDNMGAMNQDTFEALSGEIGHTFGTLVSQGNDSKSVMFAMQDSLQRMWEEQQQFGYTTDEATQALIDEAAAQGIVGEAHKSVADQMLTATNRMVEVLEGVATAMGVSIPAAADHAADRTRGAVDRMVEDFGRAHDAATEVAEGRSPSGIKQIVVRTAEAQQAVEIAANRMVQMFGQIFVAATEAGDPIYDVMLAVTEQILAFDNAAYAVQNMTDAQEAFILRADAAGVSVSDMAEVLGITTAAIELYIEQQNAATEATEEASAAQQAQVQQLEDIYTAIAEHQGAAAEAATFTADQRKFILDAIEAGVSVGDLADVLDTTTDAVSYFVDAQREANRELEAANAILSKFSDAQKNFIDSNYAIGMSIADIAALTGLSTSQVEDYIEATASASDATSLLASLSSGTGGIAAPSYYASGGEVTPFQARGTDTVPAMLTPGERVLSVDQNQNFEAVMEGPSNAEVVNAIDGLRNDLNTKLPRSLARSLHTGLVGIRTSS